MANDSILSKDDLQFALSNVRDPSKKAVIGSQRIYLASETGKLDSDELYSKINGRKSLLFIVRTVAGTECGGYISIPIDRSKGDTFYPDPEAFIFGVKRKKSPQKIISRSRPGQNHIACFDDFAPSFNGGYSLFFGFNGPLSNDNGARSNINGSPFEKPSGGSFALNGEDAFGPLADFEVRQVLFTGDAPPTPPGPTELEKLQADHASLMKQFADLKSTTDMKIASLTAENATLQNEANRKSAELAALQQQLIMVQADAAAKIAALQQQLDSSQSHSDRIAQLEKQNSQLKHDLLSRLAANIAGGTTAHVELVSEVLGIALPSGTVTSLNITIDQILQEHDIDDFVENFKPDIALPLAHLHVAVHHMHQHKALPSNKPVSEWIANVKQLTDVASKCSKLNITEEVFPKLDARRFCTFLDLSTKDMKKLQADFVASRGETFLISTE